MILKIEAPQQYININSISAFKDFSEGLYNLISKGWRNSFKSINFICIGTDRSTGDSFGPLVGHKIAGMKYANVYVHGNLDNPVHAKNLDEVVKEITAKHAEPFVVAIDACLGKMEHVGCVNIGAGPIKPGSGVNKDLAPVGDVFIKGIVNFGSCMGFMVLQNTRLGIVMKMADLVSAGIRYVLWKLNAECTEALVMD